MGVFVGCFAVCEPLAQKNLFALVRFRQAFDPSLARAHVGKSPQGQRSTSAVGTTGPAALEENDSLQRGSESNCFGLST